MPKVVTDQQIFLAAAEVYAERGYVNASTKEIADKAAVNETTIFRRYGTKQALLVAALTDLLSKSPFAGTSFSGNLEADLAAIATAFMQTNKTFGAAVFTLISEIPRHEELRPASAALLANMSVASNIAQQHQKSGRLPPGPSILILNNLIAPIVMRAAFERSFGDLKISEYEAAKYVDAFLHGNIGGV